METREQTKFFHLDEFSGLSLLQASYHRQRFARHVHETFCIGVIEEGVQRFYRTGGEHVAPKGDIILVNADEIHTGSPGVETGWAYRAIYPHPDLMRLLSRDLINANGTVPWFPEAVVHDPGLAEQFRLVFNLLTRDGDKLLKESLLLSSIASLVMRHGRTPALARELPSVGHPIHMIKDLIASCPEEDYSLGQLAEMAHLSPWHFLRQFKKQVGLPPHAWLIQARLKRAQQLLRRGLPIPAVAARCRFSDQSHFNRHFKSSVGITPGEFIRTLPPLST